MMGEYVIDRCMFEEEILRIKYSGKSKCNFSNGDKFDGYWKNGVIRNGKMTFKTGDVYEGLFDDKGQMSKGIYIWFNGNKYNGEWADSKRSGNGRMDWNDGTSYDGSWKNDVPYGAGTYIDENGELIVRIDWGTSDDDLSVLVSKKVKEGVENLPIVVAVH